MVRDLYFVVGFGFIRNGDFKMSRLTDIIAKFIHLRDNLKIPIDKIIDDKIRLRYIEEAKLFMASREHLLSLLQ